MKAMKPWYARRTTWASAAGIATAVAGLCAPNSRTQAVALATAAVLGNLGSAFARSGAVSDAFGGAAEEGPTDGVATE